MEDQKVHCLAIIRIPFGTYKGEQIKGFKVETVLQTTTQQLARMRNFHASDAFMKKHFPDLTGGVQINFVEVMRGTTQQSRLCKPDSDLPEKMILFLRQVAAQEIKLPSIKNSKVQKLITFKIENVWYRDLHGIDLNLSLVLSLDKHSQTELLLVVACTRLREKIPQLEHGNIEVHIDSAPDDAQPIEPENGSERALYYRIHEYLSQIGLDA